MLKVNLSDYYLVLNILTFSIATTNNDKENDIHYPFDKILLKDFFNHVVLLAYYMYQSEFWYFVRSKPSLPFLTLIKFSSKIQFSTKRMLLANCFEKMMNANVIPFACNVNGKCFHKHCFFFWFFFINWIYQIGFFYSDQQKTPNILEYMAKSYEIYKTLCCQRKVRLLSLILVGILKFYFGF